jgi:hypothetical protein
VEVEALLRDNVNVQPWYRENGSRHRSIPPGGDSQPVLLLLQQRNQSISLATLGDIACLMAYQLAVAWHQRLIDDRFSWTQGHADDG